MHRNQQEKNKKVRNLKKFWYPIILNNYITQIQTTTLKQTIKCSRFVIALEYAINIYLHTIVATVKQSNLFKHKNITYEHYYKML